MTKSEALANYLECELGDLDVCDDDTFDCKNGRETYLVLTDDEADNKARDSILDSVWAFRPSFLAAHSDIDEDVIKSIQDNGKCEDNNKVLLKLIGDIDHFVSDAIISDGRGHFIDIYDNQEHEFYYRDNQGIGHFLYIYRTN